MVANHISGIEEDRITRRMTIQQADNKCQKLGPAINEWTKKINESYEDKINEDDKKVHKIAGYLGNPEFFSETQYEKLIKKIEKEEYTT